MGAEHIACQRPKGHAGEHLWQSRDLGVTWRWVAATKQRPVYVQVTEPTPVAPPPPLRDPVSNREKRRQARNRRRLESRFSDVA